MEISSSNGRCAALDAACGAMVAVLEEAGVEAQALSSSAAQAPASRRAMDVIGA